MALPTKTLADFIDTYRWETRLFVLIHELGQNNFVSARGPTAQAETVELINDLFQSNMSAEPTALDRETFIDLLTNATAITQERRKSNVAGTDMLLAKFQGTHFDHDYRLYITCTTPGDYPGCFHWCSFSR